LAPKSMKNDTNCEKRFFDKSCSRCSGGLILEVPRVEVGSQSPSKNDQKTKSTWEGILASIFDECWWVLRGKLGWKIEPRAKSENKTIEKRIEKMMKKACGLEAPGGG